MKSTIQLDAEHTVNVTNPDKLLWPTLGITKLRYIKYLIDMAPYLLPYLKNKAITLIRFPEGVSGHSFFQKHLPQGAPEWVPRRKSEESEEDLIFIDDIATLIWLANLGTLEFHVGFTTEGKPNNPTSIAFDIDPSVPGFDKVRRVALALHHVLDQLQLPHIAKTSGATGLQIFIPLDGTVTFDDTKTFTKVISTYVREQLPNDVTLERLTRNRADKVYIDYPQHGQNRTLIAPYSCRATPQATVSSPITWEELERGAEPTDFTLFNMVDRVRQVGDLLEIRPALDFHHIAKFLQNNTKFI